ncbi:Fructose-bisphosphate aldolase [Alteripontixanthobacter maritimus]|uniref:fructose-bisphosphate aldolase n=1 Tax=Alteripontixanthobacter maritimus TaxID=2161824 RepID=A0A369Q867_9SPHN|nr:fructose bisphosphate aldolase [Alteripontixanthobacter maritimus]RDC59725.1 Fructose-bisphosphate aldolase [Alteripontixanthobacter maritimus]
MTFDEMKDRIANGTGFIAALDQSGGSTPKALAGYGVDESAWSGDDEMFAKIHEMRCRIVESSAFTGDRVVGAILFEKTMEGCNPEGMPIPKRLAAKGIVPFLKVDKGMHDTENGGQLMKPMPQLDENCARAKELGVFGTKMRSVIHEADETGVAANVSQQMDFGLQILGNGLVPILEPEVSLKSSTRAQAEALVLANMLEQLDRVPDGKQVMLKLTIPVEPDTYVPLVDHPKVLRVVALSGGYERDEACAELAKNHGMIASFSRALLQDLRYDMDDAQFDAALTSAIDQISAASAT